MLKKIGPVKIFYIVGGIFVTYVLIGSMLLASKTQQNQQDSVESCQKLKSDIVNNTPYSPPVICTDQNGHSITY